MDINAKLYVEIHPYEGPHAPSPHPVRDGKFDPELVYKVLGMFNPSETSECYFVLSNPQRQLWFIPQRHLLAYKLIDSDEFFLKKDFGGATESSESSSRSLPMPRPGELRTSA